MSESRGPRRKPRREPRPWPIHAFAAVFLAVSAAGLVTGLTNLELSQAKFAELQPGWGWDRDRTIITLSARASIFLIPILLIWGLGRSRARWVVGFFTSVGLISAVVSLVSAAMIGTGWLFVASNAQTLANAVALAAASALLFTPAASEWLLRSHDDGGPDYGNTRVDA